MTKNREINFKPYIGLFFMFHKKDPDIGKIVFGNELRNKVRLSSLPETILVVGEKRNFVRFLHSDGNVFWTRKTHVDPVELPAYPGSILPALNDIRKLLVYCTQSKIIDFRIETMTDMASSLLPVVNSIINKNQPKIISKK